MTIGVLSLQGDFEKHQAVIRKLGHTALRVRRREELAKCDKLVIPGGESTTFLYLIQELKLRDALIEFGMFNAVLGTCAGLIILATRVTNLPYEPLGLIDITVDRNAYGRQINSFVDTIRIALNGSQDPFKAVFIRAPRILACGANVTPVAYHKSDVVIARNTKIMVATFHPELTDDVRIHRYFLEQVG